MIGIWVANSKRAQFGDRANSGTIETRDGDGEADCLTPDLARKILQVSTNPQLRQDARGLTRAPEIRLERAGKIFENAALALAFCLFHFVAFLKNGS
jgi:hypothetical protein